MAKGTVMLSGMQPVGGQELGDMIGSIVSPQYSANKQNLKLAEYQYSKDLEMWNRQNEYNSPSEQMKRFQEAGLNPNLVAGQGNSGNASQMPNYNAPTISYDQKLPLVTNVLQTFADLDMKQAQTDKIKEEANVVKAQNDLINIQRQFWLKSEWNKYMEGWYRSDMSNLEFQTRLFNFERDYGVKARRDKNDNIIFEGDPSTGDVYRKRDMELENYNQEVGLTRARREGQENFNKFFSADRYMGWIMQLLRFIK